MLMGGLIAFLKSLSQLVYSLLNSIHTYKKRENILKDIMLMGGLIAFLKSLSQLVWYRGRDNIEVSSEFPRHLLL